MRHALKQAPSFARANGSATALGLRLSLAVGVALLCVDRTALAETALPPATPASAAAPGPTRTSPPSAGRALIPEAAPRPTAAVRVQSRFAEKVKQVQLFGGLEYLARGDFYNSPGIRVGATYYPIEALGLELQVSHYWSWLDAEAEHVKETFGALPDSHAPRWLALLGGRYSIGYGKLMVGGLGNAIHFEPQAFAHFGVHDHDGDVGPSADAGLGFLVFLTPRLFTRIDASIVFEREQKIRDRRLRVGGAPVVLVRRRALIRTRPTGPRPLGRFAAVAVAVCVGGCAAGGRQGTSGPAWRVGADGPAPEARNELLRATGDAVWRGDLGAAHAALTRLADREQALPDSALDFWSELLALLRCEPLVRLPRVGREDRVLRDPWDALRRLVQIERVRLARRVSAGPAPSIAPLAETEEASSQTTVRVVWPVEREHWSDELPTPAVVSRCGAAGNGETPAIAKSPGAAEAALVLRAARTIPNGHPGKPLLLVQAAALAIAAGQPAAAVEPIAKLDLARTDALSAGERDQVILAAALAAVADPLATADQLLARGTAALALPIEASRRRVFALAIANRLVLLGRQEDAATVLGPPPHGDDEVGRYIAFRQVEAHARAGRRAELLAEAREVLHRARRMEVEEEPALGAVMDLALHALLASTVSQETLEVLEALGPPRERLGRAEAFAQLALGAEAYGSAMTTFLWLYQTDTDANRQLQHLARASVAAARAGNRGEFARTFRLLAGQVEAPPAPAKPKHDGAGPSAARMIESPRDGALISSSEADGERVKRREVRSVNWQRALLVVARDALPALVDADDQADLATLVDTLKRHLDEGGRGPVDEELTTLYRAASAHLKSGARAYAETVGASRRPILLGDVLIGRTYDVQPPATDLTSLVGEVGPVLFVPRRGDDPAVSSQERWTGPLGPGKAGGS